MVRRISLFLFLALASVAFAQRTQGRIVPYKFFDGQYRQGGFDYSYGGTGSKVEIDKTETYKSIPTLRVNLDPNDYSGSSICLYNETFDLSKYLLDGAVEFYIKGANGGEQVLFGANIVNGNLRNRGLVSSNGHEINNSMLVNGQYYGITMYASDEQYLI